MKIAMIGSGAAGSVFAAYLRKGGAELWLVDKYKAHMDKIAADGLVFRTPEGEEVLTGFHTSATAHDIGTMDMVILMVKATQTADVMADTMPVSYTHLGSPAALSHNSAATDSLQNSDNPAGRSLRGCLRVSAVHCIRGGPSPLGLPCGSISSPQSSRMLYRQRQPRRPKPAGLPLYDAANAAVHIS